MLQSLDQPISCLAAGLTAPPPPPPKKKKNLFHTHTHIDITTSLMPHDSSNRKVAPSTLVFSRPMYNYTCIVLLLLCPQIGQVSRPQVPTESMQSARICCQGTEVFVQAKFAKPCQCLVGYSGVSYYVSDVY